MSDTIPVLNDSEVKPWYQSTAVIGGVVAMASAVLSVFGFTVDVTSQAQLSSVIVAVGSAVGGVMAVVGRIKATHKVG